MTTPANPSLEDVLTSFAVADTATEPATLREWVQLYPQFERELAELASHLPVDPMALPETGGTEAFIEKGMAGLQALLAKQPPMGDPRPIAGLFAEAKQQGLSSNALARKVGLPVTMLAMLDRKLFRFASIPAAVHSALSHALEIPERTIAAFLQGQPTFAVGAAFKSKQAPKLPEQVDFLEELERDPGLSKKARARWRTQGR